jgi:hypothetical protein
VGEAGLIYAISQHLLGRPSNFMDSILSAIASFLQILLVKILPLIPFAVIMIISLIFGSLITASLQALNNSILLGFGSALLVFLAIGFLLLSQTWTLFGLCVVLTGNPTDFVADASETLLKNKRQILKVILPFVLIDVILLASLSVVGAISNESIMVYTVTEEMAADGSSVGGPVAAGTYTSINRMINSFLATMLKGRGADLASLSLFVTDNLVYALMVAGIGLVLLPLRTAVFTTTYLTLTRPSITLE